MPTPPLDTHRIRLCRKWSQQADAYLADDPASEVDAIWFPPHRREEQDPLALLHCEAVHPDTRRVRVKALRPGRREPEHLWLSLDHVIPLTYSSLPPLSFASVASREPFFDLLGESEAYRIRCLAQVPAHLPVSPLKLARAIPGLHIVAGRKAIPGTCTGSFHWTPDGIRLEVEGHPVTGYPTEASVGLALAGWFCTRTPKGTIEISWKRGKHVKPLDALSQRIIATYQALRLPALLLFMSVRAIGLPGEEAKPLLRELLGLPPELISERLLTLHRRKEG